MTFKEKKYYKYYANTIIGITTPFIFKHCVVIILLFLFSVIHAYDIKL